jgi:hypothetical protein
MHRPGTELPLGWASEPVMVGATCLPAPVWAAGADAPAALVSAARHELEMQLDDTHVREAQDRGDAIFNEVAARQDTTQPNQRHPLENHRLLPEPHPCNSSPLWTKAGDSRAPVGRDQS